MKAKKALTKTRHASHTPRTICGAVCGTARSRLGRSRRGSVLILVVAMLVLVALMGTAMISTTRNDRFTATQNTLNSRTQLLIEGVAEMAKAAIVADLFDSTLTGTAAYRPDGGQDLPSGTSKYQNFDFNNSTDKFVTVGDFAPRDTWLASRVPVVLDASAVMDISSNPPVWRAISAPLSPAAIFESPYFGGGLPSPLFSTRASDGVNLTADQIIPTVTPAINGKRHPAFKFATNGRVFLAADADGDGIADSGLVRVPGGEVDGVTYFYAVRIIDNNSAININTALTNDAEYAADLSVLTYGGTAANSRATGMFRDSIGLAQLLRTTKPFDSASPAPSAFPDPSTTPGAHDGAELRALAKYRWNGPNPPVGVTLNASNGPDDPMADNGSTRADFRYFSIGDADDRLLAARSDNPGYGANGPLRRFGSIDAAALAYHFCMSNPNVSPSPFEQLMIDAVEASGDNIDSVYRSAPFYSSAAGVKRATASSYDLTADGNDAVAKWFNDSFDYAYENLGDSTFVPNHDGNNPPGGPIGAYPTLNATNNLQGFRSRRSLLTSVSNVSNVVPRRNQDVDSLNVGAGPTSTNNPKPVWRTANPSPVEPELRPSQMAAYPTNGSKTPVNVATFPELWRAYWQTMSRTNGATPFEDPAGVVPAIPEASGTFYDGNGFSQAASLNPGGAAEPALFKPSTTTHPYYMFRSSLRPTAAANRRVYFEPQQQMVLRAAQAAVNTESMRDPTRYYPGEKCRTIRLEAFVNGAVIKVDVVISGMMRQPFLTEVYASGNTSTGEGAAAANTKPYMAIEFFNPYPEDISLDGWTLLRINRATSAANAYLTTTVVHTFPIGGGVVVPKALTAAPDNGGYLLMENFDGATVNFRPDASGLPATGTVTDTADKKTVRIPNLSDAAGEELVLVRPMFAPSHPLMSGAAADHPVKHPELYVPVDSFDFTGFSANSTGGTTESWHYAREAGSNSSAWRFVYPGRYDGSKGKARQQGTRISEWDPVVTPVEPFAGVTPKYNALLSPKSPSQTPPITLGGPGSGTPAVANDRSNPIATYPVTFAIQALAPDQPGFNPVKPVSGTVVNQFPFGQIARNGDIMQVPFASPYIVLDADNPDEGKMLLEMNSLSMDLSFAEDGDIGDDTMSSSIPRSRNGEIQLENPGRFSPLNATGTALVTGAMQYVDSAPDPEGSYTATTASLQKAWRYRWASDLTDYLTVQAPSADYLPNVSTATYLQAGAAPALRPEPVKNGYVIASDPSATSVSQRHTEDLVPIEGLININTAPVRVLASIPWLPPQSNLDAVDGDTVEDNLQIALAIDEARRGRPAQTSPTVAPAVSPVTFQSISDLEQLFVFQNLQTKLTYVPSANGPTDAQGDFSPRGGGTDGVAYDFEEQHLLLSRVSNLITTRSDTFTVYILVQGWRTETVGTATPELVTERRDAMIVDRSAVTASNSKPSIIRIPTE